MWAGNADDEAGIFGVKPCGLVWKRENAYHYMTVALIVI